MSDAAVDALEVVNDYQLNAGIRGDALEIGVYHGRFFLGLMAALADSEFGVALDIFDNQSLNIDGSGAGAEIREAFGRNVESYGRPDAARLLQADSMSVRPSDLLALSASNQFRLISVDGGHTAEHVINDLWLSSQVIAPGGVIFLDDFFSPHWPGVAEGFLRFMMNMNRNLAPVLCAGNKLLLTTIPHQPEMVRHVREAFYPGDGKFVIDVKIAGFSYLASS